MLKAIVRWFSVSSKVDKSDNPFLYPLELDELKAELRVEHHAKRQGELGLPASDDTKLSGTEEAIRGRLENARRDAMSWATFKLKGIHNKLADLDITAVVNRAMEADKEFERRANSILSDNAQLLKTTRLKAEQARKELEHFKSENNLVRSAKVNSTTWAIVLGIGLLIMMIIEACINAELFASSFDGGFIDGLLYAGGLSAANILWSFSWGRFGLPNLNHCKWSRKLLGWIAFLPMIGGMVSIALVTSHFRDALSRGSEISSSEAAIIAGQTLFNSPFVFGDIISLMLFGLSLAFAVLSCMEGLMWKDTYPGYTDAQRHADQELNAYESEIEYIKDSLAALRKNTLAQLDDDIEKSKEDIVEYLHQLEEKRVTEQRLRGVLNKAENIMSSLIGLFRSENELFRQNAPTPAYYKDRVPLQKLVPLDFNTAAQDAQLDQQKLHQAKLLAKTEYIRHEIESSFTQKFSQLTPFRDQISQ